MERPDELHAAFGARGKGSDCSKSVIKDRKFRWRGLSITIVAALLTIAFFGPEQRSALSATNDVIALTCQSSVHVADFVYCVQQYEVLQGRTGMFVGSSPTIAASALVRVTGTFTQNCTEKGACRYVGGEYTPVQLDGTALTTDAELTTLDRTIYGTLRGQGKPSAPIKIPTQYGTSPIGDEAWAVDANTAINVALPNASSLPMFTLVMVVWLDGTTAQFIRSNSVPTLQWVYVGGSMKDKMGNPITPISGVEVKNPHSGGTGSGTIIPGSPFDLKFDGAGNCTGSATVVVPDDGTYVYNFQFPC